MNRLDRETAPVAREDGIQPPPLQVLIVEDDLPLQKALLTFVRSEGLRCEAVDDGAAALAVVEHKSPEVVILDLLMPIMDGYEFMERLVRQNGRGRPKVIVLSAKERLDLAQARLGAEAYLPKPFDAERMRAALHRLVRPVRRAQI